MLIASNSRCLISPMSHSEPFDNILEIFATAPRYAIGDFLMDLFRPTKRTERHGKMLGVFLRGRAPHTVSEKFSSDSMRLQGSSKSPENPCGH